MKKIFISRKLMLLVAAVMLSASVAKADTAPEPKSRTKNPLQKTISDYFMVPGFVLPVKTLKKDSAEKVKVFFTTDSTGRVNFAVAQSANERLKKEVEKRFVDLVLTDVPTNVVQGVVISFVLQ